MDIEGKKRIKKLLGGEHKEVFSTFLRLCETLTPEQAENFSLLDETQEIVEYIFFLNHNYSSSLQPVEEKKDLVVITSKGFLILEVTCKASDTLNDLRAKIMEKEGVSAKLYFAVLMTDEGPLLGEERLSFFNFHPNQTIYAHFMERALLQDHLDLCEGTEILYSSDFWKAPVQVGTQFFKPSDKALSIFLCSLHSLRYKFLVDSLLFAQFLMVFRKKIKFPPAALAWRNLLSGTFLEFEKHLIVTCFTKYAAQLLPESFLGENLLSYTPVVLYWILKESLQVEASIDSYVELSSKCCASDQDLKQPVMLRFKKFSEHLFNKEYLLCLSTDEREKLAGEDFTERQMTSCPRIEAFLKALPSKPSYFNIWRGETNIDVLLRNTEKRWTQQNYDSMKKDLESKRDIFQATFMKREEIGTKTPCLVLKADGGNCIYVTQKYKNQHSTYEVYDPIDQKPTVEISQVADSIPSFLPLSSSKSDARPLREVIAIIADFSSSMANNMKGTDKSKITWLKEIFGNFLDKMKGFECPNAIGVLAFGKEVKVICPISRDFDEVDRLFGEYNSVSNSTNLYGAINKAVELLQTYKIINEYVIPKDCVFRILCLTDGMDTEKNAEPFTLAQTLKDHNIVLDSFVITSNPSNFKDMRAITNSSGGWCFSNQNFVQILQREAVIFFSERQTKKIPQLQKSNFESFGDLRQYPDITDPQQKKSANVNKLAKKNPLVATSNLMSSTRTHRILSQFSELNQGSKVLPNFELFMNDEDYCFWKVLYSGPGGSKYADGIWLMTIEFGPNYPSQPPTVRFETKFYHCNVNDDGKICHQIIGSNWAPSVTVRTIFSEINDMVLNPNADDALDTTKGNLLRDDKEKYEEKILTWKKSFASLSKEEMKRIHSLA